MTLSAVGEADDPRSVVVPETVRVPCKVVVPIPTFPDEFQIPLLPPKYELLDTVRLVVEAFNEKSEVRNAPVALRFVVEAFPMYAVPEVNSVGAESAIVVDASEIVVVESVEVPTTVSADPGVEDPIPKNPLALKTESLVPELSNNSKRLVDPCPCPPCTVRVVVPVDGVSFFIASDMLDSRRLVVAFHLSIALSTLPRENTSDASSVSAVALSVFIVNVLLCVPEMVVLPAEIVLTVICLLYTSPSPRD